MKNIIVTGCSRGIGFEIVTEFSKLENFKIFAISRNKNGLNKLNNLQCNENTKIFTISEDLSCFSSYQKLFKFSRYRILCKPNINHGKMHIKLF